MMQRLSAETLLNVWERGHHLKPVQRALLLLMAVIPNQTPDTWPIGQRDAYLFRLRQHLFGDVLACYVTCPNCAAALEFDLSVETLLAARPDLSATLTVTIDDEPIHIRLPNSLDVLQAEDAKTLLRGCLLSEVELTDSAQKQLTIALAEADPLADLQINQVCPDCAHRWTSSFDIMSYLWHEI
ncbi:MAG: phage baseplate protein, partial [Anaerolineae bacterium]|nr:phage baseplate protein [Anaerolineae bacterium]